MSSSGFPRAEPACADKGPPLSTFSRGGRPDDRPAGYHDCDRPGGARRTRGPGVAGTAGAEAWSRRGAGESGGGGRQSAGRGAAARPLSTAAGRADHFGAGGRGRGWGGGRCRRFGGGGGAGLRPRSEERCGGEEVVGKGENRGWRCN